jgi:hypothetical protein
MYARWAWGYTTILSHALLINYLFLELSVLKHLKIDAKH